MTTQTVTIDQLVGNPDNPRDTLGALAELAASITEIGLLQPLLVTPRQDGTFMVVDGHRRHAAMVSVNYTLPIPVVVSDMDRTTALVAAVAAGAYSKRLTSLEKARAYLRLRDELGLTQTEIARRCGCSQATVNMTLRLLDLDTDRLTDLATGKLTAQNAIRHLRTVNRRPQGRKKHVPNPNEHPVDITICVTVAPSTDTTLLGRDVAAWFEQMHAAGHVPHSDHIVSIDDWSARTPQAAAS